MTKSSQQDDSVQNDGAQPVIPTGEEIYNQIMSEIEPDLVNQTEESLEKKYADESKGEKSARMQRYQEAMKEYDKRYEKFVADLTSEVNTYQKQEIASLERKNSAEEKEQLSYLESAISNL